MKNVLITGAGRGIGLALTKQFATRGYSILATYRNEANASGLLQFSENTSNVSTVQLDVTRAETFGPLKNKLKQLTSVDFLINNSGVIGSRSDSLLDLDVAAVAAVLDVNTLGPMRVGQVVIPFMKRGGTVAQITSLMGSITDNGSGGYYDYRMSKTALNMFNMCLAREFPHLTCLTLHPGWVKTDMGGEGATVPVEDCARGLFEVITHANPSQSGQFYDYEGNALPW